MKSLWAFYIVCELNFNYIRSVSQTSMSPFNKPILFNNELVNFFKTENIGPSVVNKYTVNSNRVQDDLYFSQKSNISAVCIVGILFNSYIRLHGGYYARRISLPLTVRIKLRITILNAITNDYMKFVEMHPDETDEAKRMHSLCVYALDNPTADVRISTSFLNPNEFCPLDVLKLIKSATVKYINVLSMKDIDEDLLKARESRNYVQLYAQLYIQSIQTD